ncbi:glutamine amidotransferase-related protein [Fulvimarina endophytica]|nr:gamma-glutamyl-gamma-aminobutyrate hydrolase family protein [Fulvimarina endophytica]
MLIGILEAGRNRDRLRDKHGSYPEMFERLLSRADPSLRFKVYTVLDDVFPNSVEECDAWLVTGSRYTAFDRLPWMLRLEAFLRDVMERGGPIVGICFGHQILAQAMGGEVRRANEGWGLGVHRYMLESRPDWMGDAPDHFALSAVHQDQVTRIPEGASVVASSTFCPAGVLVYGDKALTIQAHPEFPKDYVADLVEELAGDGIDGRTIDDARDRLASLSTDSGMIADQIVAFLRKASRSADEAPVPASAGSA